MINRIGRDIFSSFIRLIPKGVHICNTVLNHLFSD